MAVSFPLKVSLDAVDRLTAPMVRVQSRIRRLFAPIGALNARFRLLGRTAGLPAVAAGLGGVGRSLGGVGRELGSLVRKFALLGAAGVGAAAALVINYAKAGDSVAKAATRLGIGVEALQEWRYAAKLGGVDTATFDMALQRFGRRAAEAAMGTGEARRALQALGIQLTDTDGKMRPVDDLLGEVADSLAKVESPLVRNALAMKLFDSEGVKLVQVLNEGAAPIRAMREEARQLGIVLSEDAARAAERFSDAQARMGASMEGLRNEIGKALLPSLTELADHLKDLFVRVRPQVAAFAEDFMEKLPGRLAVLRAEVGKLARQFVPVLEIGGRIIRRFGLFRTVAGALAIVLGAKLIVATAAFVGSLATLGKALLVLAANVGTVLAALSPKLAAFGAALLATPIGWIIAGLAALAVAAVLIIRHWSEVKGFFVTAWRGIVGAFRWAFDWVRENVPGFTLLVDVVTAAWDALPRFFRELWENIERIFKQGAADAGRIVERFVPSLPTKLLGSVAREFGLKFEPGGADPAAARAAFRASSAPRAASGAAESYGPPSTSPVDGLIRVEFGNLPRGARVQLQKASGVDLELSAGYSMLGG